MYKKNTYLGNNTWRDKECEKYNYISHVVGHLDGVNTWCVGGEQQIFWIFPLKPNR